MRDPESGCDLWAGVTVDMQAEACSLLLAAGALTPRARRALRLETAGVALELVAQAWHGVICESVGMDDDEGARDWRQALARARERVARGEWPGHLGAP